MSIKVTEDCIGCGVCEGVATDVFEIVDGVAKVKDGADVSCDCVDEAISACPVAAIVKE